MSNRKWRHSADEIFFLHCLASGCLKIVISTTRSSIARIVFNLKCLIDSVHGTCVSASRMLVEC